ncbi:hypothetical protein QN277_003871 [Acacia crassicarpa]|uniref:non-specific serine/threonine protein kinase n=1 Tax=Acacia crassicarpa TaxID=499986 RepID=A0AAE1MHU7_9FABA|nr:hypothetical protein QN277_003871 [Acacia crassicarpa]
MIQNYFFSSSFFFFVFLYSLTRFITQCSSVNPNFEACSHTTCGNQTIKYPFYIEGRQRSFCGYPGFGLICSDNGFPMLNISNYKYVIHEISYPTQSIRVSEAVISPPNATSSSSSCAIPRIYNITLDGTRFSFASNQSDLFLLFGCNLGLLPRNFRKYSVGCSAENETISVLGMPEDGGDLRYASEKCNGSLVVQTRIGNETKGGEINGDVVRRGIVLNWVVAICSLCEETGGKCGFDTNQTAYSFKCYCPDRDHALRCDPPVPD